MGIRKSILTAALAAATITAIVPATAFADHGRRGWQDGQDRRYDDRRYDDQRRNDGRYDNRQRYRGNDRSRCRKSSGTTGLLLGGVAGALLGRAVDTRGDRAPGTIIGAGAGALAGRAIDRDSNC